jgi:hypothetical protein
VNRIEVKLPADDKLKDEVLTDKILNVFVKELNAPEEETFSMKIEKEWLTIEGKALNNRGEIIQVSGKICRLEQTDKAPIPKKKNSAEPDYWEIFGE